MVLKGHPAIRAVARVLFPREHRQDFRSPLCAQPVHTGHYA